MPRSSEAGSPIFIVGPPRSGTHLLRFCLSRHSRIAVAPESGFFVRIEGNRRLWRPISFPSRAETIVDRLLTSGDPTMTDVVPLRDELVRVVRTGPRTYAELADTLFGTIAATQGKVRWGEKTPLHVLYVERIKALFPRARILLLQRESRNTVASYLRSPLLPNDLAMAMSQIRLCVHAGAQAVARGDAFPVRYEELTSHPKQVLRDVADYVGEDFEPAMLEPGMRDSSFGESIMTRAEGIGIETHADEPRRYERVLTPEQADWVQTHLDGAHGKIPRALRARLRILEARQRFMHMRNRAGLHDLALGRRSGAS